MKWTKPSLTLGPWTRTVAHTSNKEVAIKVTQNKIGKIRSLVLELDTLMREVRVPHKRLECIRVFLIYVARTVKWMTP